MQQMLWGKPPLTDQQRRTLVDHAIALCIDRNGVLEVMAKCVIVRNYRELYVLSSDHPYGLRVI